MQITRIREEIVNQRKDSYALGDMSFAKGAMDCTEGVNPYGCPKEVLATYSRSKAEDIFNYPHDQKVFEAIIEYWSSMATLTTDNIMLTDGSIAAIYVVNNIFAKKGAKVLGIAPQFADYVTNCKMFGMEYTYMPLEKRNNFAFDVEKFLAMITEEISVVYIDNPNNPTGQFIHAGDIQRILIKAKEKGVFVIVDEAYGDFVPKGSCAMQFMDDFDNLIILRTLSKGFGMAGIRAGYIVCVAPLIEFMSRITNPYAVGQMSRRMISVALKNAYRLERDTEEFRTAKIKVRRVLGDKIKMAATEDRVPIFLLHHVDENFDLYSHLLKNGMLTVSGVSFEAIDSSCVRMRLSSEEDFPKYLKLLEDACELA